MKILIIEDEKKMQALLIDSLLRDGHEVRGESNGLQGLELARSNGFDVLLVDIMLPGIDGISLLKTLRSEQITTPVIFLSARGELDHRIEGLDAGADDYLPKPFAISELLARLRAIGRRTQAPSNNLIVIDDLSYDSLTRETRRNGQRIELSLRESLLLETLLQAAGNTVSRMEIIKRVWEYDFDPGTNIVEVYIRRLREKIDRNHPRPLIENIRGLGYRIARMS
jgi:DNA-binding response OmpR family regulator